MRHFRWLAIAFAFLPACASTPSNDAGRSPDGQPPAWTQQAARTMDGGYIIFVGQGEDFTLERAHFKASGMAIQDLVNECSLAPKGTRSEDRFEQKDGNNHYKAWVKLSIQYEDCEAAKNTVDPADVRKLANLQMTEELKRYQQMIDEPEPQALAAGDNAGMNPQLGSTSTAQSSSSGGYVRVVAVQDYNSYFWAREQIAYTKQIVILAPPAQYQPGTPQTMVYMQQMAPAQAAVHQYAVQYPVVRTWNQTYSASPVRQQQIQMRRAARAYGGRPQQRFNNRAGGRGQRSGERRRRRRDQNN